MNSLARSVFVATLTLSAALAQKWEIGGGAGGGFYTSNDISSSIGSASAKFGNNVAASAWLANNNRGLLGGELRYDYQRGDAQLTSGSDKATFAAQSHAVHYDFLLHLTPKDSAVRPFVAFGAGVKVYQGTGTEVVYQPLSKIALLTKTSDLRALVSVGGGIKVKINSVLGFRAEVHDFLTPFPSKVITPASGGKIGGWLQDFVATFGLSLLF